MAMWDELMARFQRMNPRGLMGQQGNYVPWESQEIESMLPQQDELDLSGSDRLGIAGTMAAALSGKVGSLGRDLAAAGAAGGAHKEHLMSTKLEELMQAAQQRQRDVAWDQNQLDRKRSIEAEKFSKAREQNTSAMIALKSQVDWKDPDSIAKFTEAVAASDLDPQVQDRLIEDARTEVRRADEDMGLSKAYEMAIRQAEIFNAQNPDFAYAVPESINSPAELRQLEKRGAEAQAAARVAHTEQRGDAKIAASERKQELKLADALLAQGIKSIRSNEDFKISSILHGPDKSASNKMIFTLNPSIRQNIKTEDIMAAQLGGMKIEDVYPIPDDVREATLAKYPKPSLDLDALLAKARQSYLDQDVEAMRGYVKDLNDYQNQGIQPLDDSDPRITKPPDFLAMDDDEFVSVFKNAIERNWLGSQLDAGVKVNADGEEAGSDAIQLRRIVEMRAKERYGEDWQMQVEAQGYVKRLLQKIGLPAVSRMGDPEMPDLRKPEPAPFRSFF